MTVFGFSSWGDMQRFLRANAQAAKEAATQEQWRLADGKRHYFRLPDEYAGVDVFGWTFDADTLHAEGVRKYGRAEANAEDRDLRAALKEGRVLTRSFSVLEPDGELGWQHVCQLEEITEDEFLAWSRSGWAPVGAPDPDEAYDRMREERMEMED